MRWSIIRLIWLRDLRDQLRDRRTLFMVAILPLLLYPILGFAVLKFAVGFAEKANVVGLVRGPGPGLDFPPRETPEAGRSPAPPLALLSAMPLGVGGPENLAATLGMFQHARRSLDYPLLIQDGKFTAFEGLSLQSLLLPTQSDADPTLPLAFLKLRLEFLDQPDLKPHKDSKVDLKPLVDKKVDIIVTAPEQFFAKLVKGESQLDGAAPTFTVHIRPNDDYSRQAKKRFDALLDQWKKDLKKVRLARKGLPQEFDAPFKAEELPRPSSPGTQRILDLVTRLFPFMLVMWSLAGALYPAVDLCAGEKERGTMETLLITPAGREEIVLGKFLTIWVFSFASALLNLLSMGITTWQFGARLPQGEMPLGAIFWCLILALPLSALFSAISLAIGAYARSSKEGQYYLMPLFLVTMPLVFLTMAPGVELNPFYSLVPVTGVALLMQKLMTAGDLSQVPWLYFVPVLLTIALYSGLALRWAIHQFQREDVLFREAERLDIGLWLKRLFREKEPLPTYGQALFCFAAILGLRWLSLGLGQHLPVAVNASIHLLAFVGPPALLMALLLNTRPRDALRLHAPGDKDLGLAALLALLLLPPLAAGAQLVFDQSANLTSLLQERQPLFQELHALSAGAELRTDQIGAFLLAFALLPALCEELAFRGYILTGLLQRYRPRSAIVVSAFLFGLYHMNVFQFVPAFLLGMVLGLVTVRSRSLVPAMLLHFLAKAFLLLGIHLTRAAEDVIPTELMLLWPYVVGISLAVAVLLVWRLYRKPYVEKDEQPANSTPLS